jgi:hypothetical protein
LQVVNIDAFCALVDLGAAICNQLVNLKAAGGVYDDRPRLNFCNSFGDLLFLVLGGIGGAGRCLQGCRLALIPREPALLGHLEAGKVHSPVFFRLGEGHLLQEY